MPTTIGGARSPIVHVASPASAMCDALSSLIPVADHREALERVGYVHRELVQEGRHPVAGNATGVVGADRDGHEGSQHGVVGVVAAAEQQLAVTTRDGGQHDVVQRAAERVRGWPGCRRCSPRSAPRPGWGPIVPSIESGGVRRQMLPEPPSALAGSADGAGRAERVAERRRRPTGRGSDVAGETLPGVEHDCGAGGLGCGLPRPRLGQRRVGVRRRAAR